MKIKQLLTLIAFIGTVIINGLANALPLNDRSTGEISDLYPVLFTPAGYVFSIWGLIYLLLAGFSIYQALPAQRDNRRLDGIRTWFIASSVFNIVWLFLWHYDWIPLSLLAMFGLLVSLIVIYLRLVPGRREAGLAEKVFLDLPFSVYLGWISVATIANFSIVLYSLGWNGWGLSPVTWTIIMLLVGTVLGGAMLFRNGDVAYTLVLVWAFAGITVRQMENSPTVGTAAAVMAGVLLLLILAYYLRRTLTPSRSNSLRDRRSEA